MLPAFGHKTQNGHDGLMKALPASICDHRGLTFLTTLMVTVHDRFCWPGSINATKEIRWRGGDLQMLAALNDRWTSWKELTIKTSFDRVLVIVSFT